MSEIKITADYHTHTTFSHGSGSVLDNVIAAKNKGLDLVAITDHGRNQPFVGVGDDKYPAIRKEISEAMRQVPGIKVMLGIESDIIGMSGATDLKPIDYEQLDIILCGFHLSARQENFSDYFKLSINGLFSYIFSNTKAQIRRNTKAFVNAIKKNKIDILTHIGFRLDVDYKEVSKACADYGTYLELSSRHRTPNEKTIQACIDGGANFVINSDAHKPENIGIYQYSLDLVKKYGIPERKIGNCNGKDLVLRSKR